MTLLFVTVREKVVTFAEKEKPNAGLTFSPVVSTVFRSPLEEIVQCMTQLNALYCTSVPFCSLKV